MFRILKIHVTIITLLQYNFLLCFFELAILVDPEFCYKFNPNVFLSK